VRIVGRYASNRAIPTLLWGVMVLTSTKPVPAPHPAKALMASRRLTIRALAAQVGCNASTLGRALNGYIEPWPRLRHDVAQALGAAEAECWHQEGS
jgi:lambda repressor-like predicted transcriptional regulator